MSTEKKYIVNPKPINKPIIGIKITGDEVKLFIYGKNISSSVSYLN
jgi:hypothetical protein